MYDNDSQRNHPPLCNLVPGFAFYNSVGSGLAENLVDLFEAIAGVIANIKREPAQKTSSETRTPQPVSSALVSQPEAS